MADGRLNKCKDCARQDTRTNRSNRKYYYRLYDAKRYRENPKRKQMRDTYLMSARGRQKYEACQQKYKLNNPEKIYAHSCVGHALRDGRMSKPAVCEDCGIEEKDSRGLHAHHEDYGKPLDVVWLCTTCHGLRHSKYKGVTTGMSLHDLADIRQLLDLGTEEAISDIWTRYQLTHEEALGLF